MDAVEVLDDAELKFLKLGVGLGLDLGASE